MKEDGKGKERRSGRGKLGRKEPPIDDLDGSASVESEDKRHQR